MALINVARTIEYIKDQNGNLRTFKVYRIQLGKYCIFNRWIEQSLIVFDEKQVIENE